MPSRSTEAWDTPGRATCSSSSSAPRRSRPCSGRVARTVSASPICSGSSVRLHYDAATEAFRTELRAWLEANQPTREEMREEPVTSSAHLTGWARRWQRRLFDAGLLVPGWPPELGGRSLSPVEQLVYHEEMAKFALGRSANPQGLDIIAPSILDYGSHLLQERYLRPTLRAEIAWCLGMSEPGAGSDLAGLSTRAEVHDDHFVVSGQKIWTSGAHHADHC